MAVFSIVPSFAFAQSLDPAARNAPDVYPSLAGSYTSSKQHPRVFMTSTDLKEVVTRINASGSFSSQSFSKLANKVKTDLAANVDWEARGSSESNSGAGCA